jgi:hypothetical protein
MLLHGNTYQQCLNVTFLVICTKRWLSVLNDCTTQPVTNARFTVLFQTTMYNTHLVHVYGLIIQKYRVFVTSNERMMEKYMFQYHLRINCEKTECLDRF